MILPCEASLVLPADFSTYFTQFIPEIKISSVSDTSAVFKQGVLYSFRFKKNDLEESLNSFLRSKAKSLGIAEDAELKIAALKISSVKWMILNGDSTRLSVSDRMPGLVKNDGITGEINVSTLEYAFGVPTDPFDETMIICVVDFEWSVSAGNVMLTGWPMAQKAWGKMPVLVTDTEPPHNGAISPASLYATCGDKISDFNAIVKKAGLDSKHKQNPDEIKITIIDDNPFGMIETPGKVHDINKVEGYIYVETYTEKYRQYDYNNPSSRRNADLFELDSTIYESVDESVPDNGKFSYMGPFQISKIPGASIRRAGIVRKTNAADNSAYVLSVPIASLEAEIERRYGSGASKMPLHYASVSDFVPLERNAALEYASRKSKALMLTFAACDSSGNWVVPDSSLIGDNAVFNDLLKKIGAGGRIASAKKYNTHKIYSKLYVFDNKKPNPVIVMTNTATNHTDVFTLPEYDTGQSPYSNDMDAWEFDYSGNSEAMRSIETRRRELYKASLTVAGGVKLKFRTLAYDNINKSVIKSGVAFSHGISTQIVTGQSGSAESTRYVTWKVFDPQCSGGGSLIETIGGADYFAFPEYSFKGPDSSKNQYVEFSVSDTSLFQSPPAELDAPADYNSQSPDSPYNRRKIRLVFNVTPETLPANGTGPAGDAADK